MFSAPNVYMFVYILIGTHMVPLNNNTNKQSSGKRDGSSYTRQTNLKLSHTLLIQELCR